MKKLVPDPPPILSIKPGLTHADAISKAAEYLDHALETVSQLPEQAKPRHQEALSSTQVHLRVTKAFLNVAMAKSTVNMPI
ncbi:hypothetical protein [Pseudomonas sp. Irchel 3E13]|uniref:hypothetical protein n=1 Tax=Pseudomonas sp. Irchel 3E13 TaxID=2008975 RepID=UPI000BA42FB2|nr:hypothetical protein [Pseudomonas sp. Irchel 3E13]